MGDGTRGKGGVWVRASKRVIQEQPHHWRDRAACLDKDPDLFFPETTNAGRAAEKYKAEPRAICQGCSVRKQCLEFALDAQQMGGIYGGFDPYEREQMLRVRRTRRAERQVLDQTG